MCADTPGDLIAKNISREMLIDLADEFTSRTATAHQIVAAGTDLDPRRRNRATGILRFHMNEKGFEDVALLHGGVPLINGQLPDIELAVYQPYKQFGDVLLGFATTAEPGVAPSRNKSRENAAQLNFDFSPNLGMEAVKSNTVFALLVLCRDYADPGKIAEIGVAVLSSDCSHFVFYERLEVFFARYAEPQTNVISIETTETAAQPLATLKQAPRTFEPPEGAAIAKKKKDEGGGSQ